MNTTSEIPAPPPAPLPPPADQPAQAPDAPKAPALGRSVSRGMTWYAINSTVGKLVSFLSFTILGILLSREDFGLYGISLSISAFVMVFRDGGVMQLLIQRGEAEYSRLRGPVFWMAIACNVATAVVLIALAPAAVHFYHEPRLAWMLVITGVAMPISTPGAVLYARLSMDLRFGTVSKIQMVSGLIRYGGTIILAKTGFGPLSFVLPLPVMGLFESTATYLATREKPWLDSAHPRMWLTLLGSSKWLIFIAFAVAALNQGVYFLLGLMLTKEDMGIFYFSYQLVGQVDAMLASTAAAVLFPAFAKLVTEPDRLRSATLRASRMIVLLAVPATMALLVGFPPLEDILWHNKWDAAIFPTQAIALFYTARILFAVPTSAMQARGSFRPLAWVVLFCGLCMMGGTAIGAYLHPTPDYVAVWLAASIGVGCTIFSLVAMKSIGVGPIAVIRAVVPVWTVGLLAGVAAFAVDWILGSTPAAPLQVWAAGLRDWLVNQGVHYATRDWIPAAIAAVPRLAIIGLTLTLAVAVILRLLMPRMLSDAMDLVPIRFQKLARRVVRL